MRRPPRTGHAGARRARRGLAAVGAALFLGVHVYFSVPPAPAPVLVRVADGAPLPFAEVFADLRRARVVFVGELHDQPSHHRAQLQVVRAFHEAGTPVAVALEMFRADAQEHLDRWVAGELSLGAFLDVYYDNWTLPWSYYAGIFAYAREHGLPLVGLNVPQEIIRQVAQTGFASLSDAQLAALPPVRCEVSPEYAAFIRRSLGAHGLDDRAFRNFCEAQLVWDTAMAARLLEFQRDNPEHTLVVLAGSAHAWRPGIPDQVARRQPLPTRVIVPEVPGGITAESVDRGDADYLWQGLQLR